MPVNINKLEGICVACGIHITKSDHVGVWTIKCPSCGHLQSQQECSAAYHIAEAAREKRFGSYWHKEEVNEQEPVFTKST